MTNSCTTPKILFVDDDTRLLSSIHRMLGRGFSIQTAQGGAEALEILETQGPFAVVVSDIKMPEMDGITFISQVKERHPDTVRMLLTAFANLQNALDAINSGYVFRLLMKPCNEQKLYQALSDALQQHQLIQNQYEVEGLRKLKMAMDGIVSGFVALVEARDPYTAGHQRKVTKLSLAIAESLGLDRERMECLRLGAMVHDVGKVYIPSEFLNKPAKLTEAEFTIIKAHPMVGYNILQHVDFPWPVSQVVLQHHERLDGSGYPCGAAAEQILTESRILAVADVVDAMTSHRPYRAALGIEAALDEIQQHKRTCYDEEIVEACDELLRKQGLALE